MESRLSLLHSVCSGEAPPPRPRTCFGRDELIGKVVGLAENFTPIALIGAGGIGKTSIALIVLHHHRIKQQFGNERRFIRCDQFPATRTHFLSRLSEVVGAGVENPESLAPLRPFLSSKEMILILDNAESILDPRGKDAREISGMVEELSQFETLCLCITSRISIVPRHCKRLAIPTLSMESACDVFYGIYDNGGQSDIINNLLRQLDFHALSITLLAITASNNMWDHDRLSREWGARRVQVLRTDYNESLAATIELSLASPTFRELGPNTRDLLGIVAFFPRGVDENNINWLFPTISDRNNIFDKFCTFSLTYRSNGFITMLAPLRDYLRPEDPTSSPLLRATKERYFTRLSVDVYPDKPGFAEAKWITSEDTNVEHLLDIFTTIDAKSNDVWDTCSYFMQHLISHKRRRVMLESKIEGLPDNHRSKPECLFQLSRLVASIGTRGERKQLLVRALRLWRERGDDSKIARALVFISDANRVLGLYEEGMLQAKEALEIYERLDDNSGRALSLHRLASLLYQDKRLNAAADAASRAVNLLPGKTDQFLVCQCHRLLGNIHNSNVETEKAIAHYEAGLRIASSFNWQDEQFWIHFNLAGLFLKRKSFGEAHAQIEYAKLSAADDPYRTSRAMVLQAEMWYSKGEFGEAKSELLQAVDTYEKLGAANDAEECRVILRDIEERMETPAAAGKSNPSGAGEVMKPMLLPLPANSPHQLGVPGIISLVHPDVERFEPRAPSVSPCVSKDARGGWLLYSNCVLFTISLIRCPIRIARTRVT